MNKWNKFTWGKGQAYIEELLNQLQNNQKSCYSSLKLLSIDNPFIFEIYYDSIDYDYATEYFKLDNSDIQGKCSSCRKGNLYGRNLDWSYNNDADFIIHVPRCEDRYASVGMTFKTGFDYKTVRSKKYSEEYKILPFFTVDGINEFGLVCNTNVVPIADNDIPTTKTGLNGFPEVSMKMICRYVLDHFRNVDEAVDALQNKIRIVSYDGYTKGGFEAHWCLSDTNKSVVVEIVNNEVVVTESNIMTNFYLHGVERNADGSLYSIKDNLVGEECKATTINKLGFYAAGIERFNILNDGIDSIFSVDDMFTLMQRVNYTNAYIEFEDEEKAWYSDFIGPDVAGFNITNESLKEQLYLYKDVIKDMYEKRSRESALTWQTVHQCVYDIEAKKLYVISQQNELENKVYESEIVLN